MSENSCLTSENIMVVNRDTKDENIVVKCSVKFNVAFTKYDVKFQHLFVRQFLRRTNQYDLCGSVKVLRINPTIEALIDLSKEESIDFISKNWKDFLELGLDPIYRDIVTISDTIDTITYRSFRYFDLTESQGVVCDRDLYLCNDLYTILPDVDKIRIFNGYNGTDLGTRKFKPLE